MSKTLHIISAIPKIKMPDAYKNTVLKFLVLSLIIGTNVRAVKIMAAGVAIFFPQFYFLTQHETMKNKESNG